MAARDRYNANFKCENCGNEGIVKVSEDDYPFMKKLHRDVDGVEGQISAHMNGEFEIQVTCLKCKNVGYLFKRKRS